MVCRNLPFLSLFAASSIYISLFFCSDPEAWESRGEGTWGGCCLRPLGQSGAEVVFSNALPLHKTLSALTSFIIHSSQPSLTIGWGVWSVFLFQKWRYHGEFRWSRWQGSELSLTRALVPSLVRELRSYRLYHGAKIIIMFFFFLKKVRKP